MLAGMVIPQIDADIQRVTITLGGHADLILQIGPRGVFWATELLHTEVPKELKGMFIGPTAIVDAVERYNTWKARQSK